jgi:rubredoxin-NAD+ reductase
MEPIVIIGSGLAGVSFAREYRKLERNASLIIVTADDGGFYSKPELSNALASRKSPPQLLQKSAADMRRELHATLLTGAAVTRIDVAQQVVTGPSGDLAYSRLVLALGADPIPPTLSGDGADEVLSVNDLGGYARFRAAIEGRRSVAILGAGLVGCEFANDLIAAGFAVDVIDVAALPLSRVLPPEPAMALRDALDKAGVRWHLGRSAQSVERMNPALPGQGLRITLDDGSAVQADVVLSAIGLAPRTRLASAAGLAVNRGIVVDAFLRTSDRHVYALGDCAEMNGVVLPHILPITIGARALAWSFHKKEHAASYPVMPVVVRTMSLPVVACPPAAGVSGRWHVRRLPAGIMARFIGHEGRLLGFALTGSACGKRAELIREMSVE